ncbi:MAG: ComEC/Rec2 family competence protein [Acidobacteriota bacterium]
MRKAIFLLACLLATVWAAPAAPAPGLRIYFIDVEGGQATLIATPSGESMLVDAGWPGARDADRIAAAAKSAGVKRIDYLLVTHHHLDHVGGVPDVAAKIPVVTFVDHGPSVETDALARKLQAAYDAVLPKGKHLVVKPGDRIPLAGVEVQVVAARGEAIAKPLAGAGAPNGACAGVKPQEADPSENARSAGFLLSYGKFRFADFGDLTWNKELALVCPNNLIGTTDVYLVSHHGVDISNSPAFVHALHPKVAIMNNGAKKGGSPKAWTVIRESPGLEDLWQLHTAVEGRNSPEQFIANPEGAADQGNWLALTARADGSFTVKNSRNGFEKAYKK